MAALLYDFAFVQYQDLVRHLDCTQTLSYNKSSTAFHDFVKGLLDQIFSLCVDC